MPGDRYYHDGRIGYEGEDDHLCIKKQEQKNLIPEFTFRTFHMCKFVYLRLCLDIEVLMLLSLGCMQVLLRIFHVQK